MLHQAFFSFLSCLLYVHLRSLRRNAFFELTRTYGSANHPISKAVLFQRVRTIFSQVLLSKYISPFLLCWFYTKENTRGCAFFPCGSNLGGYCEPRELSQQEVFSIFISQLRRKALFAHPILLRLQSPKVVSQIEDKSWQFIWQMG